MTSPVSPRRMTYQRLRRLTIKELSETLRDRRTVITLILMPLLVYPLLSMVFHRFLLSALPGASSQTLVIGVSEERYEDFVKRFREGDRIWQSARAEHYAEAADASEPTLRVVGVPDPAKAVRELQVDMGVHAQSVINEDPPRELRFTLLYRAKSANSKTVLDYVERRLRATNEAYYRLSLSGQGVRPRPPNQLVRQEVAPEATGGMSLATIAPLILILMTITGAVYPAIDLTAGERERGTLETLMAAPIPRLGLLLAKYIAVLVVALLTASINMAAMAATLFVSGLSQQLFGDRAFSPIVFLQVFGLLALFAAFFSAVLLTLTSLARSFKEAQAYLVPLMLLSLAPGILGAMPGLEMSPILAVCPLVNIVLLSRDLLNGQVHLGMAVVAVKVTLLYTASAIAVAAGFFGGDSVLYGSQGSWRDLLRQPRAPRQVAKASTAVFCLAVIFPLFYVFTAVLQRSDFLSLPTKMLLAGLATPFLFGVIPFAAATWNRIRIRAGFGVRFAPWLAFPVALLLGVAIWAAAHELVLLAEMVGIGGVTSETFDKIDKMLREWKTLPFWCILLAFAAGPAIFEELFFRGMLFGSMENRLSPWKNIALTALIFGVFHVVAGSVLQIERLLPSTFIGLFLGWLRYRSGSVLPSIFAHMVHNGLLLTVAYHRDWLIENGLDLGKSSHLPWTWLTGAGVVLVAAVALGQLIRPPASGRPPSQPLESDRGDVESEISKH